MALSTDSDAKAASPWLLRLPTDVWILVSRHLSFADLAALSSTHSFLLEVVDAVLWRDVFQRAAGMLLHDRTLDFHLHATSVNALHAIERSKWWFACRYMALLTAAWNDARMTAFHCNIPIVHPQTVCKKQLSHQQQQRLQHGARHALPSTLCIPAIALGTQWLIIAARSQLFFYPTHELTGPLRLDMIPNVQLDSQNVAKSGTGSPDPWRDITKIVVLDSAPSKLLVSFADGNIQLLRIHSCSQRVKVTVECHIKPPVPQEVRSISCFSADGLGAAAPTAARRDVVASLTKRGRLSLHLLHHAAHTGRNDGETATFVHSSQHWQIQHDEEQEPVLERVMLDLAVSDTEVPRTRNYRSSAFNNAPESGGVPNQSIRAWTVLLGSSAARSSDSAMNHDGAQFAWLAVGTTARERAVQIYPIHVDDEISLGLPYLLTSSSTGRSKSSVYAMAVPPPASCLPSFLLFVGYYDGVVRVFDTRDVAATTTTTDDTAPVSHYPPGYRPLRPRFKRRVLDPVAVFRHRFEGDPIYSFAFGGPKGAHLAIGDARHARVRIIDVSILSNYDVPLLSPPPPPPQDIGNGNGNGRREADATDWVAFAIPSSNSPNYGIVAHADRIFGVTDQCVWSFDFGLPLHPHAHSPDITALIQQGHPVSVTPSIRA